jgi:hypothetical protein
MHDIRYGAQDRTHQLPVQHAWTAGPATKQQAPHVQDVKFFHVSGNKSGINVKYMRYRVHIQSRGFLVPAMPPTKKITKRETHNRRDGHDKITITYGRFISEW